MAEHNTFPFLRSNLFFWSNNGRLSLALVSRAYNFVTFFVEIDRALFSGYLFCRSEAKMADHLITAPGVISMVSDSSGPLPIPAQEIEAIQRIVNACCAAEPWPIAHAGQKVRIEAGPLRGIEGVLLRARNSQRFVVSVPLLQRAVAVEIDSTSVRMHSRQLRVRCPASRNRACASAD